MSRGQKHRRVRRLRDSAQAALRCSGFERQQVVRSTLLNISESGTSSGRASGHSQRVGMRKSGSFQNGEERCSESYRSRNIYFASINAVEFCAIFSLIERQDDLEKIVSNS